MSNITPAGEIWRKNDAGFPAPDWDAIAERLEGSFAEGERDAAWSEVARRWLGSLAERLGANYFLRESANFLLVSEASAAKTAAVLEFLERCLRKIRLSLPFAVPAAKREGKFAVIIFADVDLFYLYLSGFGEDGEYATVGGVYLNEGYGHFAMPSADLNEYSAVLSHELTHALLAPLALPAWLDEAITGTIEHDITGQSPYALDREIIERHQDYWTPERLAKFWSGESFWSPDEGQELSYHLARFVLNALYRGGETPAAELTEFVQRASRDDAGHAAAREVLGVELDDVVRDLVDRG